MRLPLFFLLSAAAHAAVFAFPVSFFPERTRERLIPVVLLGGEGGNGGGLDGGAVGKKGEKGKGAPAARQHYSSTRETGSQSFPAFSGLEKMPEIKDKAPQIAPASVEAGMAIAGMQGKQEGKGTFAIGIVRAGGGGGHGANGSSGMGTGLGGSGRGGGPGGIGLSMASYAYNPKPKYPEAARREGWEGTVVVRVLVDREGRSRSVEISRSSGFDALDQAALDAVKSWRFYPAHYGPRRVESWVKVPIVFSLAELKN